jgi:hypothetical protein
MKAIGYFLFGFFLFSGSFAVCAQDADGDVKATLTLGGDKTIYRSGEPIRLILSFTAVKDGYSLNTHAQAPTSSSDEIILSPAAGAFEWAKQYKRTGYFMEDVIHSNNLSTAPTKMELMLNDFVRFEKPGKYSLRMKTRRVSGGNFRQRTLQRVELITNEVNFEIREMTPTEEEAEVKRISDAIDASRDSQTQARAAAELMYLAGDAATTEKIRRFLKPEESLGNYRQQIWLGLFVARNRQLIVKSFENAVRDASREPSYQLISLLSSFRLLDEEEKKPFADEQSRQNRLGEIRQIYVNELIESLPKRAGKNRTATALTILDNLPRENMPLDVVGRLREILLKDFDNLPFFVQEKLLGHYWEQMSDSSLADSLEKILTNPSMRNDYGAHSVSLKRLLELDAARARPFVIEEIRNQQSYVGVDILGALPDEFLPEVEDALLAQIAQAAQGGTGNSHRVSLPKKAQLAARFATAKIYEPLLSIYKNHADKWLPDAKASLVGYFARHNDAEAAALVEAEFSKIGSGYYHSFVSNLTAVNYTPKMDELLRRHLDSDDEQQAATAAYFISKNGNNPKNRELIEKRLERWLEEWKGRTAELDAADYNSKLAAQRMFQINLVQALINAKAWKLSEAEIERLKQSCSTKECQRYFPVQK